MKRSAFAVLIALAIICPALHAQGGCVDSPENPTAILGLVGSAAAFTAHLLRRRSARKS
jgi:XrtJ-associated TM-motif-TM protein